MKTSGEIKKNGVANDLISRKCSLHEKKEVLHTCVVRGNGLTGGRGYGGFPTVCAKETVY